MDVTVDQVRDLLVASFGVADQEVADDVTFAALDVDSLALVEFSLMIEKEFGVALGEDELTAELTVRDVVDLIAGRKATPR
jgi:acyl carrier protein